MWQDNLFSEMLKSEVFLSAYIDKFKYFYVNVYPKMMEYIDHLAYQIEPSAKMNAQVWSEDVELSWIYAYNSYETKKMVDNLKEWIKKRVEYLESRVNEGKF